LTRTLIAWLTLSLLVLANGACGGSRMDDRASNATSTAPSLSGLVGDQDRDSSAKDYYDSDDSEIRSYGHAASAAEAYAITTLVERYYAAAAAGDAAKACALTYYLDVETLPEQYGEPPGPRWLKGAHTCRALLSRVFAHFHSELTVSVVVTAVRVNGRHADALVGFRRLPAGHVMVHKEGASWKIDGLLAAPLT
jgi:hypothetical protein